MQSEPVHVRVLKVGDNHYLPTPCGWALITEVTPCSEAMSLIVSRLDRELGE